MGGRSSVPLCPWNLLDSLVGIFVSYPTLLFRVFSTVKHDVSTHMTGLIAILEFNVDCC